MNAERPPVVLTLADLEATPDDGKRYELIDGEFGGRSIDRRA